MDAGKVFYLTVMLWANTTVENMRLRLMVHGGHDEKSWPADTDPEKIFTLAPIIFGSNWEVLKAFHRPPESSDKDQGQTVGDLIEQDDPTWGPIRELKRAEIRGRILITLREERGLYGKPVTMTEPPTVGFTHLSDNRGGEHHPALIWVIDETEPARVLLTVHCVFDRYQMLAYLAQVFGPLLRDFRASEVEHVRHFALEDLPEDLRAYYLNVITTIGSSERPPFGDAWGYGGRLPQHMTSYGRLSEAEAITQHRAKVQDEPAPGRSVGAPIEPARGTAQEGPPAIPKPIELDARRLADIERRLLKGRIFKDRHLHTRRGPEDVRAIMRRAADTNAPPPASAQQEPTIAAPAACDRESVLARAHELRPGRGMTTREFMLEKLRILWPCEDITISEIARVTGYRATWVKRARKELGLPKRPPGRKRGQ